MKKNRILDGSVEKHIQWSNLHFAKSQRTTYQNTKQQVQITAGMGWPQRPSATQAILKIIKIKKN